MNEWYELTNALETDTPPLDEVSRARIEKRVRASLPRRRKRRWAAAVIAAALVLSACGYAAVTGQFSHWFWNKAADSQTPEASEDLLASMGTVIGQSQTVDGVTVTLNGALWDGNTLMLSLTLEGDGMPKAYYESGSSEDSWLWFSERQMEASIQEAYPDQPDVDLQAYMELSRSFAGRPQITYLYNRQEDTYQLQVQNNSLTSQNGQDELTLHLENLEFGDITLKGPFEFTFTVEKKVVSLVYEGDVAMEPIEGVPIRVTKVVLSPFQAEVFYEGLEPMERDENSDPAGYYPSLDGFLVNGEETGIRYSAGHWHGMWEDDGSWSGSASRGPFYRIMDPATVEAVKLNDTWLDLSQMELAGE